MISAAVLAAIELLNPGQAATAWSELNRHKWPTALLGIDPIHDDLYIDIMFHISDRIGWRACLFDWNKDRMSAHEFHNWFNHNYIPTRKRESHTKDLAN